MTKFSIRYLLLAACTVAVLFFLYHKTRMLTGQQHDYYIGSIQKLMALDSQFNESIMEAHQGLLTNYDPVVAGLMAMEKYSTNLENPPGSIAKDGATEILEKLTTFQKSLALKKDLQERFKAHNAVLRNSLSFFPHATTELADHLEISDHETSMALDNLVRVTLLYNLYSQYQYVVQVQEIITALRAATINTTIDRQKEIDMVIRHAETIIQYKETLDEITEKILMVPSRQQLEHLFNVYYTRYSQSLDTTNNYRLILCLATIIMLAIIAYTMITLHNTTEALTVANKTLDFKVRERTAELNYANEKLTEQTKQLTEYVKKLSLAHDELHRISVTDELTGLYTRRFLFEWLEKEVVSLHRSAGKLACLLCDVDHFKKVNDSFGHQCGDQVLQAVSMILKQEVRQADIVGRYGGEEFLILLPNTGQQGAKNIAEKIRSCIEEKLHVPRQITISIGSSVLRSLGSTNIEVDGSGIISMLLDQADTALYQAKRNGRNRFEESSLSIDI